VRVAAERHHRAAHAEQQTVDLRTGKNLFCIVRSSGSSGSSLR
jgi:hypothetical protein